MAKISVVMPVYNVAEYVGECLQSIQNQSLYDIEIICVNDGSTDNSLEILNRYAEKDRRIIVINKKNEGSGIARNTALKLANGEYVYFIDSDDWLDNDKVLEEMYKKAAWDNLDMLIFGGYSCYVDDKNNVHKTRGGYSLKLIPHKYLNCVFSAKDVKHDIFKFPSTCWTKLYKREFLQKNNIEFQAITVGQDQLPFFHSMITAERIGVLDKCLYCYRKNRKNSAMTVRKKKHFSPVFVLQGIEDLLIKMGKIDEYDTIFINKYFSKATSWLGKFDTALKPTYYKEYIKMLAHLKETYPKGWWKYFKPNVEDSYKTLKVKQFIAKTKFMLLK